MPEPFMPGSSVPGRSGTPKPVEEAGAGSSAPWPERARSTGDPAVDAVLGLLERVEDQPVSAHAELYTTVHDALLAELTEDA